MSLSLTVVKDKDNHRNCKLKAKEPEKYYLPGSFWRILWLSDWTKEENFCFLATSIGLNTTSSSKSQTKSFGFLRRRWESPAPKEEAAITPRRVALPRWRAIRGEWWLWWVRDPPLSASSVAEFRKNIGNNPSVPLSKSKVGIIAQEVAIDNQPPSNLPIYILAYLWVFVKLNR